MTEFLRNKKYILLGGIILAAALALTSFVRATMEWQDASGEGSLGQSCVEWLGGGDIQTRIDQGGGWYMDGKCVYKGLQGGMDVWYAGDKNSKSATLKPVAQAGTRTIGVGENSQTQIYREAIAQPAFKIQPSSLTMKKGESVNLSAQIINPSTGNWINLPLSTGIWKMLIAKWSSSNTSVATVVIGGTQTGTTVTAVGAGTAVVKGEYTVVFNNNSTQTYSQEVTVTVKPLPPAAPTNLTATYDQQNNEVDLTWNAADKADGYKVFRAASVYQELAQLAGGGIINYSDDAFSCSSKGAFTYKLVAYNAGGDSTASNEVEVPVQGALSPGCASEVFPTCSVSNATPSRGLTVDFRGTNFNTDKYKYIWNQAGCQDNSPTCITGPLINDQSYGVYKIEVKDFDSEVVKQTVSCPAVDVRIPKLKAEVIPR